MDSKWDRLKGKISNIFFEEVVGDDEHYSNEVEHEPQVGNKTKSSFRFPVIPDADIPESSNKRKYIPAKVQSKRVPRKKNHQRTYPASNSSYQLYQREKRLKEMEEIPAFLRRKQAQDQIDSKKRNRESEINSGRKNVEATGRKDHSLHSNKDQQQFPENQQNSLGTTFTAKKSHSLDIPSYKRRGENLTDRKTHVKDNVGHRKKGISSNQFHTFKNDGQQNKDHDYDVQNPMDLLADPVIQDVDDMKWVQEQQRLLEQALNNFNIAAKVVHVTQGPSVTRFEIQPELGVKVSKIRNLADDLKLNLAAKEIRIEAPIPGRNTVGIEVPNQFPQMVTLKEIVETSVFHQHASPLTIALGLTIEGEPLITNIEKMPHGLIAGATGSGKSVCINTILISLLYKSHHDEVKFLLIDPKMVELAPYNGIPHLISPVITDAKAATAALNWAVNEMESRYEKFVQASVRNIEKYNEKVVNGQLDDEKMPFLVIVIDELADLMMVSPQDVEDAICRIAQKARAAGIHLLLATQRPSVDVITGLIKANIPTRIAFTVSSQVDSRTILDSNGAEKLLGKGDMLFIENGSGKSLRLQGPFVSDDEINRVTNYMRSIAKPNYFFEQEQLLNVTEMEDEDELLHDVIVFVVENNQASTSLLQRQFRIGYNRAARLIDLLYDKGIIGGPNGSKPREVLLTKSQLEDYLKTT